MWLIVFFVTVAVIISVLAPRQPATESEREATMYFLQLILLAPGILIAGIFRGKFNLDFPFTILVRSYASILDGFIFATITTGLAFAVYRIRLRLKNKKSL